MHKILELFKTTMENKPTIFGSFHIICFVIMIIITIVLCLLFRKPSDKKLRIIVLSFAILLILFEIYKQITYTFTPTNEGIQSVYQWYIFPFQFCSTPMYVALLAGLLKPSKLRDVLFSFLATFGLFGGLVVMIYPGDVFSKTLGINIQTMVHHSSMVIIGVFLLVNKIIKVNRFTLLKASIVFVILVLIALLLNIIAYKSEINGTFNMFFISPYYKCTLVILDKIYELVPYPVFLIIYISGFTLIAGIISLLGYLIQKIKFLNRSDLIV